jgi:hypothetical protein|nr:hypothetical protein [Kofleriaceae bacterium]
MRRTVAAGFVVGLLAAAGMAGDAGANGRYPATNGIFFNPADAHSLYVRTTFGLLISHDDGCTFDWVCEQAIGYGGTFDPKYRVAADGSIFATTMYGLEVSHDGGCSFESTHFGSADGSGNAQQFLDAIDLGPSGELWVGTTQDDTLNGVYVSTDNGSSFGLKLSSTSELYKSVRVAPSNAARVYVTSYDLGSGSAAGTFLYRSDDDGSDWTPLPLPANVAFGVTPLVEVFAIDPAAPDTVFVSSVGANAPIGDVLYRSSDGGQTFAEVLRTTTAVHDMAFADGSAVYVTQEPTSDDAGNLTPSPAFLSSDGGKTFATLTGAPELECVSSRGDGEVYGCGQNWDPDHEAVAKLAGGSWSDVFRFVQMAGPLACSATSGETMQCGPQWSSLQDMFGTTGPTCGSNVEGGGDAGAGGGGGGGGAGGGGAGGGGGCDAGASGPLWLVGGLAIGLIAIGRRRQRASNARQLG